MIAISLRRDRGATRSAPQSTSPMRTLIFVLFPFVTGYFLSYYFRSVNAVLSGRLMSDVGLDAAALGLMTSAYFLMAALSQIPGGILLDRYGPRRVQSACLLVAAAGSLVFSIAQDATMLFVGRALIGLGIATALMAGLKALAMSVPLGQVSLYNGVFIGLGATGALAASWPTERLLGIVSWRELFAITAAGAVASALLIALLAPREVPALSTGPARKSMGIADIYRDAGFWRLAPLSALAIGGAWALQGLWAGPWLRDVAYLGQDDIARQLLIVAACLSIAAVAFGIAINRLARFGVGPETTLGVAALIFIAAEIGLALGWPMPPIVLWSTVGAFGAGTVLSYTITALRYPKESIGRANGALNLLHFGAAFLVQSVVGRLVAEWPRDEVGRYPPESYATALLALASLQLLALLWFLKPLPPMIAAADALLAIDSSPAPGRPLFRRVLMLTALGLIGTIVLHSLPGRFYPTIARLQAAFVSAPAGGQAHADLQDRIDRIARDLDDNRRRMAEANIRIAGLGSEFAALRRDIEALAIALAPGRSQSIASPTSAVIGTSPPVQAPCSARTAQEAVRVTVRFTRNTLTIGEADRDRLDHFADLALTCPNGRIIVRGYTDDHGPTGLNLRLSHTRARLVSDYLARAGLPTERFDVAGLGPINPIADNTSNEGRRRNRRVEIELRLP